MTRSLKVRSAFVMTTKDERMRFSPFSVVSGNRTHHMTKNPREYLSPFIDSANSRLGGSLIFAPTLEYVDVSDDEDDEVTKLLEGYHISLIGGENYFKPLFCIRGWARIVLRGNAYERFESFEWYPHGRLHVQVARIGCSPGLLSGEVAAAGRSVDEFAADLSGRIRDALEAVAPSVVCARAMLASGTGP